MKLSISNIAWNKEDDGYMYSKIMEYGFSGLEIAPTRFFDNPYDNINRIIKVKEEIKGKYDLNISSMQSIWFGRNERIFKTKEERRILIEYTKKAIDYANAICCRNIVFGCPKNRIIDVEYSYDTAIAFFEEIANYALENNTCVALEANPKIYGTDFINDTKDALKFIKKINCNGFKLNLDIGTIIENKEDISLLRNNVKFINHVHVSEPNLDLIKHRNLHKEIREILKEENYDGYISIEMKRQNIDSILEAMSYVKDIFRG